MTNNFIAANIFLVINHITDNKEVSTLYDMANYIMGIDAV